MRIGILTGGGDVPGLNPCIKAVVNRVSEAGHSVVGIRRGWGGLLNANPDDFLDWDKPLSEQAPRVRAALEEMRVTGETDMQTKARLQDGVDQMRALGIPGIRYLDAGSRGAGEGTRNYVVFDDKLIEILRRYGLLPPLAAGGAGLLSGGEAEANQ